MGFFVSAPACSPRRTYRFRSSACPQFPKYIYQVPSGLLIFRMRIPLDCRSMIGKRELQYSLKTHCVYSARQQVAFILPFLNQVFDEIRHGFYEDMPDGLAPTLQRAIRKIIMGKAVGTPVLQDTASLLHSGRHQELEEVQPLTPAKESLPLPEATSQPSAKVTTRAEVKETLFSTVIGIVTLTNGNGTFRIGLTGKLCKLPALFHGSITFNL